MDAQVFHDALAAKIPYTFRHGKVLVTVRSITWQDNILTVLDADASYENKPVTLDLPLHFVNAAVRADPLGEAQTLIADLVRHIVGK